MFIVTNRCYYIFYNQIFQVKVKYSPFTVNKVNKGVKFVGAFQLVGHSAVAKSEKGPVSG